MCIIVVDPTKSGVVVPSGVVAIVSAVDDEDVEATVDGGLVVALDVLPGEEFPCMDTVEVVARMGHPRNWGPCAGICDSGQHPNGDMQFTGRSIFSSISGICENSVKSQISKESRETSTSFSTCKWKAYRMWGRPP